MQDNETIKLIAESLLEQFIPKDKNATELTFHFTLPPSNSYKVFFKKEKNKWLFVNAEQQKDIK